MTLGPGPWRAANARVTKADVLSVLAKLPAPTHDLERVFVGSWEKIRQTYLALDVLKRANLAHYDRAARVWRRTEPDKESP